MVHSVLWWHLGQHDSCWWPGVYLAPGHQQSCWHRPGLRCCFWLKSDFFSEVRNLNMICEDLSQNLSQKQHLTPVHQNTVHNLTYNASCHTDNYYKQLLKKLRNCIIVCFVLSNCLQIWKKKFCHLIFCTFKFLTERNGNHTCMITYNVWDIFTKISICNSILCNCNKLLVLYNKRERLSLSAFLRTEDIGVHIVHISHLIITYTLEQLSPLT